VAFYRFFDFPECQEFQPVLKQFLVDRDIRGTVLVTPEGINGTVSGRPEAIDELVDYLRADERMAPMPFKFSEHEGHAFERTKVKYKQEIIKLGCPVDAVHGTGEYVKPADWNDLISDPEVVVIDTRNDYEVHLGQFKNAVNPHMGRFVELPEYLDEALDPTKHKKVAMYCTGGIRCEKSTAYLKERGFDQVFHLEGGILKYLEDVPEEESLWEGSCFVFDDRIALDHKLESAAEAAICPACGHTLFTKDFNHPDFEEGIRCPHCPANDP
jgi:UPF0176 protein